VDGPVDQAVGRERGSDLMLRFDFDPDALGFREQRDLSGPNFTLFAATHDEARGFGF
jgi:hypothetical protein